MSWIAITDGRRALRAYDPAISTLVTAGSLVIEATFSPPDLQTLVDFQRSQGWDRGFRMTLAADGTLSVEHWQNLEMTRTQLKLRAPDADAILRITYVWDGPRRLGYLSAENLDTGGLDQVAFDNPQPWPSDDIAALASGQDACQIDHSVSLLALSDKVEPAGLATGLVSGTMVETPMGPRPVQDLVAGDLVLTADHGLQPVRAVLTREVPNVTGFAPIRLSAPFFGLQRDLNVAPDHRILIDGADAEYLFGTDAVLVEARHLAGMALPSMKSEAGTVSYTQLILDNHECVQASGIWVETMYLGGLSECPLRLATSGLADLGLARLPRHAEIVSPLLKSYEAVVLVSAMCA